MNTPTPRTDVLDTADAPEGTVWEEVLAVAKELRGALAAARSQIEMLRTGDTCARHCEGTAYRIEARRLATDLAAAQTGLTDWLYANGPNGWIEKLRTDLAAAQEKIAQLEIERDSLGTQLEQAAQERQP